LLLWIFSYFRYKENLGIAVAVYPLFYVLLSPPFWGYMILADVLQGQVILIVFFEVIRYLHLT
jgi:hypothetical protein